MFSCCRILDCSYAVLGTGKIDQGRGSDLIQSEGRPISRVPDFVYFELSTPYSFKISLSYEFTGYFILSYPPPHKASRLS
jgi:hypothetical protein